MELGFDRDDTLGDIAEGLRAEQGTGFKKTLFYKIQDKAGHPLTTTAHWYDADNGLGHYEWLTLVKIFGTGFANRSLARLGYKVVPLDGGEIDASELDDIAARAEALLKDIYKMQRSSDGAGKPKLREVGK